MMINLRNGQELNILIILLSLQLFIMGESFKSCS